MFRPKSPTQFALVLSLTIAILWSLLACGSLCALETSLYDSQSSTCETIAATTADGLEPIEDCCFCPDISSPIATVQQRETGERIFAVEAIAIPARVFIQPDDNSSARIAEVLSESLSTIYAPPLFLRLNTFRI